MTISAKCSLETGKEVWDSAPRDLREAIADKGIGDKVALKRFAAIVGVERDERFPGLKFNQLRETEKRWVCLGVERISK